MWLKQFYRTKVQIFLFLDHERKSAWILCELPQIVFWSDHCLKVYQLGSTSSCWKRHSDSLKLGSHWRRRQMRRRKRKLEIPYKPSKIEMGQKRAEGFVSSVPSPFYRVCMGFPRPLPSRSLVWTKLNVTVHVGMDQNIEIEIFAEYKYILNELPVKKKYFFQYV